MKSQTYWFSSLVLAFLGVLDTAYLTWLKLTRNEAFCLGGIGDCAKVNSSPYSEFMGVPIALFGLLTYLTLLVLLGWVEPRGGDWAQWARYGVFGLTFFGTLYSAYLTYLELAVIHAVCPFCVLSALLLLFLLILAIIRLLSVPQE
ncbi:MAG TPA: vitamin K epoxide reductase family protein [Anaerolineae bacterium]|nr:vitamin K epoxide reductase family protein [Anaerolineae bacterium]HIQ08982.1 vitamin K epoxide reductase family protein [Anaerolineaceae bacterium]